MVININSKPINNNSTDTTITASSPNARILIVEPDTSLLTVLSLVIRKHYDVDVVAKGSKSAVIEYLKKDHNFKCIIVDDETSRGAASKIAIFSQNTFDISVPVISLVNQFSASIDNKFVYAKAIKPDVINPLIQALDSFLPKRKKISMSNSSSTDNSNSNSTSNSLSQYFFIQLEEILCFNYLDIDCYIKISEEKVLKILKKGDIFSVADYDKYKARGISGLYILYSDLNELIDKLFLNFKTLYDLNFYTSAENLANLSFNKNEMFSEEKTATVISSIVQALQNAEDQKLSYDDGMNISKQTIETIYETTAKFGVNSLTQHLTKAAVILSLSFIRSSPFLNNLFESSKKTVFENNDNYLVDHSVLLANIACLVASMRGWSSNLTYYKLVLAAFLHDMPLKNPKLARFRTTGDLMNRCHEFKDSELKEYMNHPQDAAKMIENYRMIPPDIGLIILEHHEKADGSGFPRGLNYSSISSLGQLFIVAHDIVSFIFSRSFKDIDAEVDGVTSEEDNNELNSQSVNLISFLNQHRMLYQHGEFKSIFDVLWNHFKFTKVASKFAR
ncbi:MAG: hypothetical protein HQK51_02785 [Oligoflexia bacterium]|nr:hypothetical protein [Oligoflexia bacterium]